MDPVRYMPLPSEGRWARTTKVRRQRHGSSCRGQRDHGSCGESPKPGVGSKLGLFNTSLTTALFSLASSVSHHLLYKYALLDRRGKDATLPSISRTSSAVVKGSFSSLSLLQTR